MLCYCFTATLRFSQTAYTFAEEDGVGAVMVEGTPGFTARVFGRKRTFLYSMLKTVYICMFT